MARTRFERITLIFLHVSRHFLLLLCVAAVLAVLVLAREYRRAEVYLEARFPPSTATMVEAVEAASDFDTLRKVCGVVAKVTHETVQAEFAEQNAFLDLVRMGIKLALGFSAVCAVALLAAWLAAGGVLRNHRKPVQAGHD